MPFRRAAALAATFAALTLQTGCMRDINMTDPVFHSASLAEFQPELQSIRPGLAPDDFHAVPSARESFQRLRLGESGPVEDFVPLEGWRLDSDYDLVVAPGAAYLFELMGMARIDPSGPKVAKDLLLGEEVVTLRTPGLLWIDPADGSLLASMARTPSVDQAQNALEIRRYSPDLQAKVVSSFPIHKELLPLGDGYAVVPDGPYQADLPGYQVFRADGSVVAGVLPRLLDSIWQRGAKLEGPRGGDWRPDGLWVRSLNARWGIFSHPDYPNGPPTKTSILTLSDPPQAVGILFQSKTPLPERIEDLVVSPTHDLFFATVREGEDSLLLWMGVVRKEKDRFVSVTYRVRSFAKVRDLVISRDGSILALASQSEAGWSLEMARLEDILTDINRRYPEAKLSLGALESEVK